MNKGESEYGVSPLVEDKLSKGKMKCRMRKTGRVGSPFMLWIQLASGFPRQSGWNPWWQGCFSTLTGSVSKIQLLRSGQKKKNNNNEHTLLHSLKLCQLQLALSQTCHHLHCLWKNILLKGDGVCLSSCLICTTFYKLQANKRPLRLKEVCSHSAVISQIP